MDNKLNRRDFIKYIGLTGAYLMSSFYGMKNTYASWKEKAFNTDNLDSAINLIKEDKDIVSAKNEVEVKLPDIAETGGKVPIEVKSNIKETQAITIFVEGNPLPLISSFKFNGKTEPYISTFMKMQQTSNVIVMVDDGTKIYQTIKKVNVAAGGC